jgi:single-stranded DNA-binding protein
VLRERLQNQQTGNKNQCQNRKGKYKMTGKELENNQVTIIGEVISTFSYNHEIYGEGFYMVELRVERLSNSYDIIPVMISERLIDVTGDFRGQFLAVQGQFRSYNRHDERKNKLVLSVFAREVSFMELDEENMPESNKTNSIFLDGYICKEPIYRKTPLGREIADLLLAVNRPYGKSDYIPCISWGRNARYAGNFKVGDRVAVWGRIQSREYMKRIDEDMVEKRTAYEVSVSKLEMVEEEFV